MRASRWPLSMLVVLCVTTALRAGLECPQPLAQAGTVRSGTPLTYVFRLVNSGSQAIRITEVHASCGCLAPRLERRQVGPGESTELQVAINTLTQAAGAHTWQVRVSYQEGERSDELTVVLGARIVSEVAVEPPALTLTTDGVLAHEVVVSDRRPKPLRLRAAEVSTPYLRASTGAPRRDPAGRSVCTIRLEVSPECPAGRHEAVLHIHTDDSTYPILDVPVTVVKRPPHQVRPLPDAVTVAAAAGQPVPSRIVLLSAPGEEAVGVERVEADDPAIECQWAPGPGNRATLKVRIDRGRVAGDTLRGTIRVHLSHPEPQTLVLPVTCTLR
jgi:hypothetical protein